ncbi:MAG: hypothetical protein MUP14_06685 [Dehalococcoidia bacterium]|nr:hypothetical protein [Dehalococcoidia bacterium]
MPKRIAFVVAVALLAAIVGFLGSGDRAQAGGSFIRVVADLPDPPELTMFAFDNPTGATDIQLRAFLVHDDGSSQDVTTLADWASSNPEIGVVDSSGFFHGTGLGSTFVTASLGPDTSAPVLVQTVPTVETGSPNAPAAALPHSLADGASKDDSAIRRGVSNVIVELQKAGIDTGALYSAFLKGHFHEERVNSGGVNVPAGKLAVMCRPGGGPLGLLGIGINFAGSQIAIVYDGNTHTVFNAQDAENLRQGNVVRPPLGLTDSASTAVHELLHAKIFRESIDCGSRDDEEALVTQAESLIDDVVAAFRNPALKPGLITRMTNLFQDISTRKGGPQLLDQLGITGIVDGGGIAEAIVVGSDSAARASGSSSGRDYAAPLAAAVAGVVTLLALTGGGWYARRRWLR